MFSLAHPVAEVYIYLGDYILNFSSRSYTFSDSEVLFWTPIGTEPFGMTGENAMDESINTTNKRQILQKPPLSNSRIAGEILAGLVIGVAIALPVSYPILYVFLLEGLPAKGGFSGEFAAFGYLALGVSVLSFLIAYGPAVAVGIYLVGNIGKQTGSFLVTLVGGLVGAFCVFIPSLVLLTCGKVIFYLSLLPLLLIPASMATVGFNLTRKYKVQKKQIESAKSKVWIILIVLAVCSIVPTIIYIGSFGLIIPLILLILALRLK